jgi:hypothetical protein
MRLFSWAGGAALAAAAGFGFLVGTAVHRPAGCVRVCDAPDASEVSEAPPVAARPQPPEEIDLSCLPTLPYDFGPQSTEPPLADASAAVPGVLRAVSFELPAGPLDGPELPTPPAALPHLTDDGDAPPARLPMIVEDGVDLPPGPEAKPGDPVFQAVQIFFEDAAQLPAAPCAGGPACPQAGDGEVTDKVPLGKPPTCERPPSAEVGACPGCPGGAKVPCGEPSAIPPEKFVGPLLPEEFKQRPPGEEAQEAPQARVPRRLAPLGREVETAYRPRIDTLEIRPGDVPRPRLDEPY